MLRLNALHTEFSLLALHWMIILGSLMFAQFAGTAFGQPFPLPPPLPSNGDQEERIADGDKSPPEIEILTEDLHAGINVFEVRITDDSTLRVREVRYVQDGQFKSEGLFRDQNNVYKALIDIEPPSRIIVVKAGDAAGNMASDFEEYNIADGSDLLSRIIDTLRDIPEYLQRVLSSIWH